MSERGGVERQRGEGWSVREGRGGALRGEGGAPGEGESEMSEEGSGGASGEGGGEASEENEVSLRVQKFTPQP